MKTEVIEYVKNLVLPLVEVEVEKQINERSDALVEMLVKKLVAAIPGGIDDAILLPMLPKLQADAKSYLLGQAEKISDKV